MGVVLDFPQALVEAFPLVWFPIFVFVFFVKEQIFRAQEGAGERQSRGEAGAEGEPGPAGGARQRLRLVGAEEEDGVLVRWGFHGAVRDVIDLKGNPKHQEVRDSGDTSSAPASGVGSGTRLEPSAAGKHPDGALATEPSPCGISTRATGRIRHRGLVGKRGLCATPPGSMAGPRQCGRGAVDERPQGRSWLEPGRRKSPAAGRTPRLLCSKGEPRGAQGVLGRSSGRGDPSPKKQAS